jgi:dienelactone hydrolase
MGFKPKPSLMKNKLLYVLALSVLLFFGITGYHFLTGWPPLAMMLLAMGLGLLVLGALYLILGGLGKVLETVPKAHLLAFGSALGALVALKLFGFGWPDNVFYPVTLLVLIVLASGYWYFRGKSRWALGTFIATGLGCLAVLYFLVWPGQDPYAKAILPASAYYDVPLTPASLENPAKLGSFKVLRFTYGSGTDEQRQEFAEGATYTTAAVDARLLLPEWKGKKKKWRERYWGFGPDAFPLNGRVYLPEGTGPFPLTLIVHGNHGMIDHSDNGYGYLGELLASKGIIAVSVDENFVNGHWSGDFMGKEMPVRAWLLLKHLEQWSKWNQEDKHPLSGKVDMDNIMLIGHSRGGEAVTMAGVYNKLPYFPDRAEVPFAFNFGIKGIVALAPTDYRYDRKMVLKNVDYLTLQGSYDADETSFWGMRPFHRMRFTDSLPHFKAGIYVHGANHGQFNSTWGRSDFGAPRKWLLNLAPLMPQEEQETVAKVCIGAFAEAVLKGNTAYLPLFKQVAWGKAWLPERYLLTQFASSNFQGWTDFEEDLDLTTAGDSLRLQAEGFALWRELNLRTRDQDFRDNNALVLGWDNADEKTTKSPPFMKSASPKAFFPWPGKGRSYN